MFLGRIRRKNAVIIISSVGAAPAGAFDLVAACSGFVYALNVADSLIRSGRHRKVAVITFTVFLVVWVVLTLIGFAFRGPNWGWVWPWEEWHGVF